jgi:hypothetical protein
MNDIKNRIRYILSKHYGHVDERTVDEIYELVKGN